MMTTALQTGRTRAQNDLLVAERSLRNQVESNVRDLRQLLLELAVRFDGQRLEALRRDDPSAPTHWSPDDWRSFFSAIQFAVAGWETQKDLRGKRELRQQVEGMRAQIQTLTGQLENAQLALAEKEAALAGAVADAKMRHTSKKGEATNTKETLPITLLTDLPEGVTPPTSILVADVKSIVVTLPKEPPAAFSKVISGGGRHGGDRTRAFQRYWMVLRLLGHWRLSARMEAEDIMARALGVSSGSGSLRRIFEDLAETNLLTTETISLSAPRTALKLYRLSEEGRKLHQLLFEKQAQESEWERLNRMHEGERFKQHTLAVLAFAIHARKRGWATQVLPELSETNAEPDLWIMRGDESFYVEVELQTKERPPKWRNLSQVNNGKVALCAATPDKRARLVGDCKLDKLSGLATDLETLVQEKYSTIGDETPLWVETW